MHFWTDRFQLVDGIVSDGQDLKPLEAVHVANHLNAVVEENQVLEFDEGRQAFNLLNIVERQVYTTTEKNIINWSKHIVYCMILSSCS